jgi:hypothetical protein
MWQIQWLSRVGQKLHSHRIQGEKYEVDHEDDDKRILWPILALNCLIDIITKCVRLIEWCKTAKVNKHKYRPASTTLHPFQIECKELS